MFTGKIEEVVSKYSSLCIDLRADEVLISACAVTGLQAGELKQALGAGGARQNDLYGPGSPLGSKQAQAAPNGE